MSRSRNFHRFAYGAIKQNCRIPLGWHCGLNLPDHVSDVTPGEVLPAGDLLGDLLLEIGRPADAVAAYEAVLAASPNRLNTLYGAGFAAERAGDMLKAREYFEKVTKTAAGADAGVDRVDHARRFLAQNHASL